MLVAKVQRQERLWAGGTGRGFWDGALCSSPVGRVAGGSSVVMGWDRTGKEARQKINENKWPRKVATSHLLLRLPPRGSISLMPPMGNSAWLFN